MWPRDAPRARLGAPDARGEPSGVRLSRPPAAMASASRPVSRSASREFAPEPLACLCRAVIAERGEYSLRGLHRRSRPEHFPAQLPEDFPVDPIHPDHRAIRTDRASPLMCAMQPYTKARAPRPCARLMTHMRRHRRRSAHGLAAGNENPRPAPAGPCARRMLPGVPPSRVRAVLERPSTSVRNDPQLRRVDADPFAGLARRLPMLAPAIALPCRVPDDLAVIQRTMQHFVNRGWRPAGRPRPLGSRRRCPVRVQSFAIRV